MQFALALAAAFIAVPAVLAQQCPATVPAQGAAPPGPLPLFPADNWWNADITSAPVDPGSTSFIAFINNGGTRRLHPDFGGEASPGSLDIYGMPYAIVDGAQPKRAVTFDYWDESDGVDRSTGQGVPFYPIPRQAITQPHWIEGGAPGTSTSVTSRIATCWCSTARTGTSTSSTTSITTRARRSGMRVRVPSST